MENRKVWLVLYHDADFQDGNGIYETKEKALDAINKEFERLPDTWADLRLVDEGPNCLHPWEYYEFNYIGENAELLNNPNACGISVQQMPIL